MASLTLRSIGMSYALEPEPPGALELDRLLAALAEAFGPAVAALNSGGSGAILIDRKAASRPELLRAIEVACRELGMRAGGWCEDSDPPGHRARLGLDEGETPECPAV
jgi:hypothetical protein